MLESLEDFSDPIDDPEKRLNMVKELTEDMYPPLKEFS